MESENKTSGSKAETKDWVPVHYFFLFMSPWIKAHLKITNVAFSSYVRQLIPSILGQFVVSFLSLSTLIVLRHWVSVGNTVDWFTQHHFQSLSSGFSFTEGMAEGKLKAPNQRVLTARTLYVIKVLPIRCIPVRLDLQPR